MPRFTGCVRNSVVSKTGRPTDYKPEYVGQAYDLCRIGAVDEDLALFFNVCDKTIANWKNEHTDFLQAIKKGKAETDRRIGGKLIDRASGAEWVEEKEIKLKRIEYENGKKLLEEERVEVVELRKSAPPDTTALIFFLKNRRPDLWRDRQDVNLGGQDGNPVQLDQKLEVVLVAAKGSSDA